MRVVLLHALPFDARMWDIAGSPMDGALAPDLYTLGDSLQEWASAILDDCRGEEMVLVGSSVGGSCALEIARASPGQVRGIVLVGAKATVRPDPELRDAAVKVLDTEGIAGAWRRYWAPLFGPGTDPAVLRAARDLAFEQDVDALIRGIRTFHDRRDHADFISTWNRHLVVVTGAHDRTPTPAAAAASLGVAAHRSVIVQNCGHYVPLEQPAVFDEILARQFRHLGTGGHLERG